MKKVNVSELKARLSHYLRMVKAGAEVTVVDRNLPIAKLICLQPELSAAENITLEAAIYSMHEALSNMPTLITKNKNFDSLELLLQERNR